MFKRVTDMPMQLRTRNLLVAAIMASSVVFGANAADVETVIDKGADRAAQAQQAQQKVDSIDDTTRSAERDYRAAIKEADGLKVYIQQLDKQLASQQSELDGIEQSIDQVTLVERQITPLMLRMIDSIDQFVQADVPFRKEERTQRVDALKELMGRSDVTVAEKYRKVMDAYLREIDYGRTIESYRGNLDGREVDFLRVGRTSLIYQTLDGHEMGVFNPDSRQWQALDAGYKSNVMAAIRIAREQAAPDLIKVPVAAPQEAK